MPHIQLNHSENSAGPGNNKHFLKMPNYIAKKSSRLKLFIFIIIGSAFGLGLSPIAPGTCGAIIGLAIHIAIWSLAPQSAQMYIIVSFFLLICAMHFCLTPWAVNYWKNKDPKNFVLDEIAGYLLVPILFQHGKLWQVACWGFFWFRLFDIIKLPVARQIDKKMHGAWGILIDDLVSSVYAVIMLYILRYIGYRFGVEQYLIST